MTVHPFQIPAVVKMVQAPRNVTLFVFNVVDAQVEREARQEHHKEGKREQVLEVKTIFLFTVTILM